MQHSFLGRALLPWGDGTDRIDRYDVRFLLDSMSLAIRDGRPLLPSAEEKREEEACEEERYRDMYLEIEAKEKGRFVSRAFFIPLILIPFFFFFKLVEEQEKRVKAAITGFHAVAFQYKNEAPAAAPAAAEAKSLEAGTLRRGCCV